LITTHSDGTANVSTRSLFKTSVPLSTWPFRHPVSFASPWAQNFIVFDISGPHLVTINYCDCRDEPLSTWTQLLHEKWFPATLTRPQMAFTFDCLETFHELTLQGKTNLYDYYHTLLWRSDNANLSNPIVSSRSYLSSLTNSYINSIGTRNFIMYLECGGI